MISRLIKDAAVDPYVLMRLQKDPATVYKAYGLTTAEIALLQAGDKRQISEHIPPFSIKSQAGGHKLTQQMDSTGSLLVAGSGITSIAHITLETVGAIEKADVVFYLVIDQQTINWIIEKRPDARPLYHHYQNNKSRRSSYEGMVMEIMAEVRKGRNVVAVFYGHPGVLVYPGHRAIEQAKTENYYARMLPGISADACLISDLGIDPATHGMQSFEATQFLNNKKSIDVTTPVVMWQIGVVGNISYSPGDMVFSAFEDIFSRLSDLYGPNHNFCVYEASEFTAVPPSLHWISFADVAQKDIRPMSTLYIPPRS